MSGSRRSPVIAFSNEIEHWARMRGRSDESKSIYENTADFLETRRETRELVVELRAARAEQKRLLASIRKQMVTQRALSATASRLL